MFIQYYKSNMQSVMIHTPQKPKKLSWRVYYGGEIIDWAKYGGLRPNCYFSPAIIIPSKVAWGIRCFINEHYFNEFITRIICIT